MEKSELEETVYYLCLEQMKSLQGSVVEGYENCMKIGFELWKRLKPIFLRLSEEMKSKSIFTASSVWVLDDMPYDYVLCESINKKTGELGLKIGIRSMGLFINETFHFPKDVDTMNWEDVLAFAIKNDAVAASIQPGAIDRLGRTAFFSH